MGRPLVVTIDKLVCYLNDSEDEISLVMKIFKISTLMKHNYNAYDYRENLERDLEVHDIFKLMNIYGYGVCKQFTMLMGYLLDSFMIKNRILYLGRNSEFEFDHFAIEVYYKGRWHYFDPNIGIYFINKREEIVSIEELKEKNFHKVIGDFSAKDWIRINDKFEYLKDNKNSFKKNYFFKCLII